MAFELFTENHTLVYKDKQGQEATKPRGAVQVEALREEFWMGTPEGQEEAEEDLQRRLWTFKLTSQEASLTYRVMEDEEEPEAPLPLEVYHRRGFNTPTLPEDPSLLAAAHLAVNGLSEVAFTDGFLLDQLLDAGKALEEKLWRLEHPQEAALEDKAREVKAQAAEEEHKARQAAFAQEDALTQAENIVRALKVLSQGGFPQDCPLEEVVAGYGGENLLSQGSFASYEDFLFMRKFLSMERIPGSLTVEAFLTRLRELEPKAQEALEATGAKEA